MLLEWADFRPNRQNLLVIFSALDATIGMRVRKEAPCSDVAWHASQQWRRCPLSISRENGSIVTVF